MANDTLESLGELEDQLKKLTSLIDMGAKNITDSEECLRAAIQAVELVQKISKQTQVLISMADAIERVPHAIDALSQETRHDILRAIDVANGASELQKHRLLEITTFAERSKMDIEEQLNAIAASTQEVHKKVDQLAVNTYLRIDRIMFAIIFFAVIVAVAGGAIAYNS